jgi:hypothetical protein
MITNLFCQLVCLCRGHDYKIEALVDNKIIMIERPKILLFDQRTCRRCGYTPNKKLNVWAKN